MTKKNQILLLAGIAVLVICLCIVAACIGNGRSEGTADTADTAAGTVGTEKRDYRVVVKSEAGKALEGVGVYFYTDSTQTELVWFAKTDAEGKAGFTDLASDTYVAVLDKVPEGYLAEAFYPLTGELTEITLTADLAEGDLENITYHLGDLMLNFTVTAPDGTAYMLSELLQEKQAVVLNFWYLQCGPCKSEFPYLQQAYQDYSDKIEVLAMNPINDDDEAIEAYRKELGLTFPMVHCDPAWEKAMQLTGYPTTVVIDCTGTISLIHKGAVTDAKVFRDAFAFFTADDYKPTLVEKIEDLEIEETGSNKDNPIEIGGKTSFQVTVKPGQLVYCNLYRLNAMNLVIRNANAYAVYDGRTYRASGGQLSFKIYCPDTFTPAEVAFGNSGTETQTYTVTLTADAGTHGNPYQLEIGTEFETHSAAGNDQGVYYIYTATQDGILKLQCLNVTPGVHYDYILYNHSTYAMRTIQQDGDASTGTVTIPVKKGQRVQLTISTLPDSSNTYPSATFTSIATLGEDTGEEADKGKIIDYAVTVTDENRKPLRNVYLNWNEGEETVTIYTNESGVATIRQVEGTYTFSVILPKGYTRDCTEFKVTKEHPFVSIKLETLVLETKTYTVSVVNEAGEPIENALVTIDTSFAYTDSEGKASFTIPKDDYTVHVTPPEGYTSDSAGYSLKADDENLTITLQEGSSGGGPVEGTVAYTVTVVDYSGRPQADVAVRFLKDGAAVGVQTTDSRGAARANLVSDDYTVSLAFSGKTLYYETKHAVLPKGTTSLTIRVAEAAGDEGEDLYVGYAPYVSTGGNYVSLSTEGSYFMFNPTKSGVYRFTTSDPEAVIYYYGANSNFISNQTDYTDYDPITNSFTLNIKSSNIGASYILFVKGAPDCILEITRIGEEILDDSDVEAQVYEAKTPPKKYTLQMPTGKSIQYLDLTVDADDYQLVKGSDGYYHLNSASGPLLYMNLGTKAPYLHLAEMVGYNSVTGAGFLAYIYNDDGTLLRKEDFTACMLQYAECMDQTYGVYPLTDDLIYMVKTGGTAKGWWDMDSPNCLFVDNNGVVDTSINPELGWMFAVCYVG